MKLSHLLAAVAVLGLAGFAFAAEKDKDKHGSKGLAGKVTAVDTTAKTLKLHTKTGEVTVTTDDNTEITVNGQAGTLGDIKADMVAMVTPATGTATKVVAKNAEQKGDKGGDHGGKKGKKDKGGHGDAGGAE